jgi:uncharacterized repeat protein (TIGR01451 family)
MLKSVTEASTTRPQSRFLKTLLALLLTLSMMLSAPMAWAASSGNQNGIAGVVPLGVFGSNGIPDAPSRGQASVIKFVAAEANYLGGIAVDYAGKVWTWGYNAYGQLGTGRSVGDYAGGMMRLPYFVDNNINIVDIEGGYHTSFAVDDKGVVYAWGNGTQGQMGNGTTTASNTTPVIVSSLAGKRIVKVVCSTEWECAAFAIDDQGNVYAWGSGLYNRIPGTSTSANKTARQISQFDSINVAQMSIGDRFGLVLDTSGQVYAWGTNTDGQLGQGNTTTYKDPVKIAFFSGKVVTQISAEYDTAMAVTSDGQAYIWGRRYVMSGNTRTSYTSPANPTDLPYTYSPYGVLKELKVPELVSFDLKSSPYNTVAPQVASVTAGRYVNYLIDVNGRTWFMGWNTFYGFGTDGRLFTTVNGGKHSTYVTDMTLLRYLGDGDTEGYLNDVKGPVFSGATATGDFTSQFNSYKKFGQWSEMGDGLHPTIYDKKYMVTTDDGITNNHTYKYPLDSAGRRLVYVVRLESKSPNRYSGNFYVASASYNGAWIVDNRTTTELPAGVTAVTSVPMVKEDERSWIGLVVDLDNFDYTGSRLNDLPYMSQITTYQSASLFVDNAGNLYRTSLDGSGSIAWGWDYSVYEQGTAGNNAARGLYNFYFYEIMYMRGAPNVGFVEVTFDKPTNKLYIVPDGAGNTPAETVTVTATVPGTVVSSQLNLTVTPELKELKYVFIPYNTNDPNFNLEDFSADQFMAAYNSGGYQAGDLLDANLRYLEGDYAFAVDVRDNGKIWVLAQDHAYTRDEYHSAIYLIDNFYTPIEINHQGIGVVGNYQTILYPATADNVVKTQKVYSPLYTDTSSTYGIPLDVNGNVIPNPTYGYDVVTVSKYPVLPGGQDAYYAFRTSPAQENPKVFTLDNTGQLVFDGSGVQIPYVHNFYYNSTGTAAFTVTKSVVDELDHNNSAAPGELLSYTIRAINSGTAPAFEVLIRDPLTGVLPYVNYSPTDVVVVNNGGVISYQTIQSLTEGFTVYEIGIGATVTVSFQVTVKTELDTRVVTSLSNTATVYGTPATVTLPARYLDNCVVRVGVEWVQVPDVGQPASVQVQLYKDGVATGQYLTIYKNNGWQGAFTDLEPYHAYSVVETTVPTGCVVSYSSSVTPTPINNTVDLTVINTRGSF